ncbi:MAG: LPS export ABC transporter periplasmic protein LptC [Gammaproteobacteria bacterium]
MRLQDFKIYFNVAGLALASWLLVKFTGVDMVGTEPVPPHSPDFFSNGYTKREMSDSGRLTNKLTADKMTHYSDDGTTHLSNPLIYFYNVTTPPWRVRSEAGVMSADGKDLFLNGTVRVEREKAEGLRPLTINTSNVKVKPEISYAETGEWAELISGSNRTAGTGMKMVFAEPIRLELLADVKGKYETK